jgi:NAD(P)-dependent dehydrogenase (short-subunit alcohol dehydrogenase family)
MEASISAKNYVITGATSGIGWAAAQQVAQQGAHVIGIGRSAERCRAAEEELRNVGGPQAAHYIASDLSLQSGVRFAAEKVREHMDGLNNGALDGLLNNAGTFRYWLTLTLEGHEMQWALNHLCPFLMTQELLPLLRAAPAARVVTVSSGSHYGAKMRWEDLELRRRYNGLTAYEQTKLANVLFTCELNRRLGMQSTVRAFAADPGLVKTDIGMKDTPAFVRWIWKTRSASGMDPAESAKGIVFLLMEPSLQQSTEPYWLHGKPKAPSAYARREDVARRLWAASEKMCGVQEDS